MCLGGGKGKLVVHHSHARVARLAFFYATFQNMAFSSTAWHKIFFCGIFLKCGIIMAFFQIVWHIFRKSGILVEMMVLMGGGE